MSDWYWRIIAFKAAFVLTCLASYLRADDSVPKLPFCNPHTIDDASNSNDLLIVSTLDGKLTAFSTEKGLKAWHLDTQPLLSSNLHHVELTSGGKWVRLVPSLRGGLYSLSGDTIEPLPFDAEQLLSASFKYSEDMVIAGARETHWLGVDARTGGIIYECGTAGCSGEQATAGAGRDVLVLRRQASTVRALDPRTGSEKWNFSVAEHQLALSRRECAGGVGGAEGAGAARVAIGVALPEGVVVVRRPGEGGNLWQYKLDAPVTNMWRLSDGSLQNVDVLWEATQSLTDRGSQLSPPSIYIGVHDTQLYIQEGLQYAEKLDTAVTTSSVPWKLLHTRPLLTSDTAVGNVDSLSLVTLYGGSGQTGNHGFFLYLQETCDQAVQVTEDIIDANETPTELPNDHHHVHIHVYSLWFWWKEVLLIAISSALLMNLMIWPRFFAPRLRTSTPLPITNETVIEEKHYEYSGRYENDFTPVRCLGRGGFGVVFEARNNIDHRSYAVKRITLPKKESKRERVLREVRALAKLEHEHIVRYFNAWLEVPPPLWQQQRDAIWCRELENMSVISDEYTATSPAPVSPRPEARKPGCVLLNLQSPDDALDNIRRMSEPSRHRSLSCNDSFSVVFDENANTDSKTLSQISSKKSMSKTSEPPNMLTKTNDDSFIVFANNSKTSNSGIDKLSKNMASGDNDSFIVFANTEDLSKGLSEARKETSVNKQLERVRQCDGFADSSVSKKKKKGHTRHWSLDLCVKSTTERAPIANEPKMYLYIQMQLCMKDSLHDWLRQNRCAESRGDKIKTLFSQIVSAVEYVHLAGLIHRDLKPSNIFFAPDGRVKVGDFGLVTAMNDNSQDGDSPTEIDAHAKHTFKVGTHLYMSPEQLLCRSYSYKVDIYSLGVILFELLQPFGSESERVASLMRLRSGHYPGDFGEKCPNEMEALKLMLSEEPSLRPTAMGVRARAPLWQDTDKRWHFTLPSVDRDVQLDCGNC